MSSPITRHTPWEQLPATLSIAETAAVLGLSENSIREAIHRRDLPAVRLGRRVLIPKRGLQELLDGAADAPPADRTLLKLSG